MNETPFRNFEDVIVTELVDGDACSVSFKDGKVTIRIDDTSVALKALASEPSLSTFFGRHPEAVVNAVVYGHRRLRYGKVQGDVGLAVIDVFDGERWLDPAEARLKAYDLHFVPTIAVGHFRKDWLAFNKGRTHLGGAEHERGGCVIRPQKNRVDESGENIIQIIRNDK